MPIALNEAEQKEVYRKRQRDLKAALDKQACCMMQHTRLLRASMHQTACNAQFYSIHSVQILLRAACTRQHAPGSTHQAACNKAQLSTPLQLA